jgi:hypothetical protein
MSKMFVMKPILLRAWMNSLGFLENSELENYLTKYQIQINMMPIS